MGSVVLTLTSSSLSHNGIKLYLLGQIELITTRIAKPHPFIQLSKDLVPPGTINQSPSSFRFCFNNVELAYESYRGIQFNVRYIIKAEIKVGLRTLAWEREFGVVSYAKKEILDVCNNPIQMEIGIGNWLRLTFIVDHEMYATKGVVTGTVVFKRVSMKLQSMILQIIRRETIIGGETDTALLCRYEIMDGAPISNLTVPFRFFLSPYELTPTYENVNNKFSVKYYLNLVLFDTNNERYFKQHEIKLVRIPRVPPKKI